MQYILDFFNAILVYFIKTTQFFIWVYFLGISLNTIKLTSMWLVNVVLNLHRVKTWS